MTIKSIQKVIKVGSSLAVTLPARDAKNANISAGQDVEISVKSVEKVIEKSKRSDLTAEYEAFKAQYGSTLKNLADR